MSIPNQSHIAAHHGRADCVLELIYHGAEVDLINTKGWTPLHCAADADRVNVCKVLVENNAPLGSKDKSQMTPFQLTCKRGHLDSGVQTEVKYWLLTH